MSPSRLKLPKGPGSLEGIGENAEPNLSMGLMTYGVPLEVPSGYELATPSVRLVYSSGAGNSEVGLGWALTVPSIERMTSKGLPRYDALDLFASGSSDELVRVDDEAGIYRARYEGGFVRYTWIDPKHEGKAGYWKAEYPDGRVGTFGARRDGSIVSNARVEGPNGVFRYQLVDMVDPLDHVVRYEYEKDGSYSVLRRISYGFQGDGEDDPRYRIEFSYEPRPDVISDARPGFDVRLGERLTGIHVLVRGVQLRRYALRYYDPNVLTYLSRLERVQMYGANDEGPYPIDFGFEYTGAAGSGSQTSGEVITLPEGLGIDFSVGKSELIDINGDGLPDVVDTTEDNHRFFINTPNAEGDVAFSEAKHSEFASVRLDQPSVQTVDLDGDGFTDLIDTSPGGGSAAVFWNHGDGDWVDRVTANNTGLPDFSQLQNLRFFDYDNDKRPDLLFNDGSSAFVYRNQGNLSFSEDDDVEPLGQSFNALQLADMNGDSMQDAVELAHGLVAYKLNLGFGRWSGWIEMKEAPEVASETVRLTDINGDGLSDLVLVVADQVKYALNHDGRSFGPLVSIDVPESATDTSVRFADLNGSGSVDVVWITHDGEVSYLELFPVRANLLRRITSGAGKVIEVEYGSSVGHMLAAEEHGDPWGHRLPNPMLTVDRITTYDTLSRVEQTRRFEYRDGYYDGEEKQFRGFERVTAVSEGDETVEGGVTTFAEEGATTYQFDVGRTDPYKKALLKHQTIRSGGRVLSEQDSAFDDCSVGGLPSEVSSDWASRPVRYVCLVDSETTVKEEPDRSMWPDIGDPKWVTLREEYDYDGYGNRTRTTKHGVFEMQGGCPACQRGSGVFGAPCGGKCLGDESIEVTEFVPPTATNGRWMLNNPSRQMRYGAEDGSIYTETVFHYDGAPFEGLDEGQLTRGLLMKTEARVDSDDWVATERVWRDETHGNPIEVLDANGHSRRFSYDETGLFLTSEEVLFDESDPPYSLLMTASYHPLYEKIIKASSWMRVEGGSATTSARNTLFEFDEFGRLVKIAQPGDTLEAPTEVFSYDIRSPFSRIIRRARSRSGGELDVQEVQCFDGLGRKLETRSKIDGQRYQVSGWTAFDRQGNARAQYQPFAGTGNSCDSAPPTGLLATRSSYDATQRVLEVTQPDRALYGGTASVARNRYEPLRTFAFDAEDTDPASPHAGTPEVTISDGLGRTTGIDRYLGPDDVVHLELTYDELGNLRGHMQRSGAQTIEKVQEYDLLGRVRRVLDPDSGETLFNYDPAGNVVYERDARKKVVRSSYDQANRLLSQWEEGHEETTEIRYTYDVLAGCAECTNLAGELARVTFPMSEAGDILGEDVAGYDLRGQPIYSRRTLDGHVFELRTELDNLGRVIAREYPTGTRIESRLDGLGRLTAVPGYVTSVTYDNRGLPDVMELGNGATTTYGYDQLTRLASLETETSKGKRLQSYAYGRDRVGNILRIADDSELEREGDPSANAEYDYDDWYRLTGAHLDVGRPPEEHLTYGYDALDNITEKTSSAGSASPDHVGDYEYEPTRPHAVVKAGDLTMAHGGGSPGRRIA